MSTAVKEPDNLDPGPATKRTSARNLGRGLGRRASVWNAGLKSQVSRVYYCENAGVQRALREESKLCRPVRRRDARARRFSKTGSQETPRSSIAIYNVSASLNNREYIYELGLNIEMNVSRNTRRKGTVNRLGCRRAHLRIPVIPNSFSF